MVSDVCIPGASRSKWSPMPGTFSDISLSPLSKVTPGGGFQPSGRLGGYEIRRNIVPPGPGKAFVPLSIGSGSKPVSRGTPLSHVEFIECQSRIGVDRHHLGSY